MKKENKLFLFLSSIVILLQLFVAYIIQINNTPATLISSVAKFIFFLMNFIIIPALVIFSSVCLYKIFKLLFSNKTIAVSASIMHCIIMISVPFFVASIIPYFIWIITLFIIIELSKEKKDSWADFPERDKLKQDRKLLLIFIILWGVFDIIFSVVKEPTPPILVEISLVFKYGCIILSALYLYKVLRWCKFPKVSPWVVVLLSLIPLFKFPLLFACVAVGFFISSGRLLKNRIK